MTGWTNRLLRGLPRAKKSRVHVALRFNLRTQPAQHEERETVSERWIPMLAAVVGLVGGLGGAAIGGSIANAGQEQQFRNQRIADLNNLLNETYSRYLRTSATAYLRRTLAGHRGKN